MQEVRKRNLDLLTEAMRGLEKGYNDLDFKVMSQALDNIKDIDTILAMSDGRTAINALKTNDTDIEGTEIDDNIAEKNTLFSLDESPLDYVLSKELIERVSKAVKDLPPQYKKVFELSRYKNLTYVEISEEMGVSVNAVKLYQKKALAQLRQVLKEYLPASLD